MRPSSDLFGETVGAEFSPCRTYRYRLWRLWDERPHCLFVMLNPSTATEVANDPTVSRCIAYARKLGYGGCVVVNIFAYRATDPVEMKQAKDPVGPENDKAILRCANDAGLLVAAWGAHGKHKGRSRYVRGMLHGAGINVHCLSVTADGEPRHPLYLSGEIEPMPFPFEPWPP